MADINPKIFKAYDIRAIYPTELNEEGAKEIAKAIYVFFTQKLQKQKVTIATAYDMRVSSPAIYKAVTETFLELGGDVVDLGMLSTPTFYFAVSHYGYDTGLQVTASHNPKEYTGMKFVMKGPKGLIKIGKPTGMEDIKHMVMNGVNFTPGEKGTLTEKKGSLEDEVQNALALLNNPQLKELKVVADSANAMGGPYIEELFKHIPGNLIKMNFELDGTFPVHQPDPLQFDLWGDLRKRIIDEKADLALATDGDGDRLFFYDEKANVIPGTMITALVAKEFLKKFPGEQILYDLRNIMTPEAIVKEFGGKGQITKVGHAFITEALNNTGAIFAGEGSGHYFYRSTGNAESQVITILTVLLVMTEEGKPLSQIIEELRRSYEAPEINFEVTNSAEILTELKEKYKDGELLELDGVTITYPDWRFNVRTSNTEPLLRLNLESKEAVTTQEKTKEVTEFLQTLGAKPKTSGH